MKIEREREREKGKITCKCTERKPRVCRSQCFLIIFRPKNKDAEQEMEKESMREGRGGEGSGGERRDNSSVATILCSIQSAPCPETPVCSSVSALLGSLLTSLLLLSLSLLCDATQELLADPSEASTSTALARVSSASSPTAASIPASRFHFAHPTPWTNSSSSPL